MYASRSFIILKRRVDKELKSQTKDVKCRMMIKTEEMLDVRELLSSINETDWTRLGALESKHVILLLLLLATTSSTLCI